MTDYEYIMAQCRKYHFTQWDENKLRECQEALPNLTREELVRLYRSKWVDESLRKTIIKILFADKVGKREERIKNLSTEDLILEFQEKKSGNVALIRKEMRERYKANEGNDRYIITQAFNVSTKSDQQWMMSLARKEKHGDSNSNGH